MTQLLTLNITSVFLILICMALAVTRRSNAASAALFKMHGKQYMAQLNCISATAGVCGKVTQNVQVM